MIIKRIINIVFNALAWSAFLLIFALFLIGIYNTIQREAAAEQVEPVETVQPLPVVDTAKEPDVVILNCVVIEKTDTAQSEALYNVPLEADLQRFIISKAEEIGIDPAVIFGMAHKESTYNPGAIGDNGNSLGLLQIQPRWNMERMKRLDCLDLLDPFQNVTVAADLLSELMGKYGDVSIALTVYNFGHYPGYVTEYATAVLNTAEGLTKAVTVNAHP